MGEPVQAAAHDDGTRPARLVDGEAVHVLGGRHLVGPPAGPRTAEPDVQAAREGGGGEVVDHPQVARALVDHPGAVGGGVPGVEGVVVGVPAQVGAVVGAGVEVADALVVGEEGDPSADEHRAGEVAVDVGEQVPAVQPDAAGGAAPVALPGGGLVRRRAGQQQGPALAVDVGDGDVRDGPPGQPSAGVAVGGHAVRPGEVGEGLSVRGDREDVAVRRPSAHLGVGAAPVGEPSAGAAVHRGQVDLGDEAAPARVGDGPAVRGEARVAGLGAVHGDPPGAPGPVGRGDPEVVLGDEAQPVPADVREAEIAGGVLVAGRGVVGVAHLPMLFRRRGPGNSWTRPVGGGPARRRVPPPVPYARAPPPVPAGGVTQPTYETVSFRWGRGYLRGHTHPCRTKQR